MTFLEYLSEQNSSKSIAPPELIQTLRGTPRVVNKSKRVMYHATPHSFKKFLTDKTGDNNSNAERGVYFGTSKKDIEEYVRRTASGYVYSVNSTGLGIVDGDKNMNTMRWLMDIYLHRYPNGIDYWEEMEGKFFDFGGSPRWSIIPKWLPDTLEAALISAGIDGCKYKSYSDYGEYFPEVYCIWNVKKLKVLSKQKIG